MTHRHLLRASNFCISIPSAARQSLQVPLRCAFRKCLLPCASTCCLSNDIQILDSDLKVSHPIFWLPTHIFGSKLEDSFSDNPFQPGTRFVFIFFFVPALASVDPAENVKVPAQVSEDSQVLTVHRL